MDCQYYVNADMTFRQIVDCCEDGNKNPSLYQRKSFLPEETNRTDLYHNAGSCRASVYLYPEIIHQDLGSSPVPDIDRHFR